VFISVVAPEPTLQIFTGGELLATFGRFDHLSILGRPQKNFQGGGNGKKTEK